MPNEQDQFLKDLESDQNTSLDILDNPFIDESEKDESQQGATGATGQGELDLSGDDGELKPRNRRERRLMRKIEAERESNIFMAGKMQAQKEARKILSEESDYLKGIEKIYGTESPEAVLATDLLKKAIVGARDDAENRAYSRFKAEREQEAEEARKAEREIENVLEDIEDTYGISFTEAQESSYLNLLQKMSPKDEAGRTVKLADPHAVFEIFQERLKSRGSGNRAKDLSARSMVQSGAVTKSNIQDDSASRFLKENGII